jgi:hypothetical protein
MSHATTITKINDVCLLLCCAYWPYKDGPKRRLKHRIDSQTVASERKLSLVIN